MKIRKSEELVRFMRNVTFVPPGATSAEEDPVQYTVEAVNGSFKSSGICPHLSFSRLKLDHSAVHSAIISHAGSIIHLTNAQKVREFSRYAVTILLGAALSDWKRVHDVVDVEINGISPLLSAAIISELCRVSGAHRERGVVESRIHPWGYQVQFAPRKVVVLQREPVYLQGEVERADSVPVGFEFRQLAA